MKYENEIDNILRDLLFESWMDEEDYNYVIEETFKQMNITKQTLCDNIQVGIDNGYTLKEQLSLFKRVLYCLD